MCSTDCFPEVSGQAVVSPRNDSSRLLAVTVLMTRRRIMFMIRVCIVAIDVVSRRNFHGF